MAIFEEVTFKWKEKSYTIPPGVVLRCIAAVEDSGVTLGDLVIDANGARLPLARLAIAMGTALRFAGARVSDEEVYDGVVGDPVGLRLQALTMAVALQQLMIPPARMREAQEKAEAIARQKAEKDEPGKAEAGPAPKTDAS